MGAIIYWSLIRIAILIPLLWYFSDKFETRYFLLYAILIIIFIGFYPAFIQYKKFVNQTKEVVEDTLCSSCQHFDKTAVVCMKYDEHPTKEYIPCDGIHWEP